MTRELLAPPPDARPGDRCVRCGQPTPPGVSLCDADNPGKIAAPSATQMHGTILVGVILAAVGFLLLARLLVGSGGPFQASIIGRATLPDGGTEVAIRVANQGSSDGIATCRVTRDGTPRQDDLSFRTERIAAGASLELTRTLPAVARPPYDPSRMTAVCG
jgi:hypothetical protein